MTGIRDYVVKSNLSVGEVADLRARAEKAEAEVTALNAIAAETYARLREERDALQAERDALRAACGGDLDPGEQQSCGPLAWLRSAIDTLSEDAVRGAAQGDDPDAYLEMVAEVRRLHDRLRALLSAAPVGVERSPSEEA